MRIKGVCPADPAVCGSDEAILLAAAEPGEHDDQHALSCNIIDAYAAGPAAPAAGRALRNATRG